VKIGCALRYSYFGRRLHALKTRVAMWACLGALMFISGCADGLILYPSTEKIHAIGNERVALPFDGGVLEVWRRSSSSGTEPEIYVLTFCGNAERAEHAVGRVQRWAARPVEMWAMNYPGYGGSTGPARLSAIGPAALEAYDALKKRAGGKPVFVNGMSLGTAAALYVGAKRPCAGLVLANPPPLQDLILRQYGWWNLWMLAGPVAMGVPSELNSVKNGPHCRAPAIFISAEHDEIVPAKYHRMVIDAYGGKKRVIVLRGAGHNDPPDDEDEERIRAAIGGMVSG